MNLIIFANNLIIKLCNKNNLFNLYSKDLNCFIPNLIKKKKKKIRKNKKATRNNK